MCVLLAASLGAEGRQVVVHGFRNPATGLEVREASVGFVVGFSPNIVDRAPNGENRTTWFTKTGLLFYPHGSGVTFDGGLRWASAMGLDLRLGAVLLAGFDGRMRWNPAPGIGWVVPLGEKE